MAASSLSCYLGHHASASAACHVGLYLSLGMVGGKAWEREADGTSLGEGQVAGASCQEA